MTELKIYFYTSNTAWLFNIKFSCPQTVDAGGGSRVVTMSFDLYNHDDYDCYDDEWWYQWYVHIYSKNKIKMKLASFMLYHFNWFGLEIWNGKWDKKN